MSAEKQGHERDGENLAGDWRRLWADFVEMPVCRCPSGECCAMGLCSDEPTESRRRLDRAIRETGD